MEGMDGERRARYSEGGREKKKESGKGRSGRKRMRIRWEGKGETSARSKTNDAVDGVGWERRVSERERTGREWMEERKGGERERMIGERVGERRGSGKTERQRAHDAPEREGARGEKGRRARGTNGEGRGGEEREVRQEGRDGKEWTGREGREREGSDAPREVEADDAFEGAREGWGEKRGEKKKGRKEKKGMNINGAEGEERGSRTNGARAANPEPTAQSTSSSRRVAEKCGSGGGREKKGTERMDRRGKKSEGAGRNESASQNEANDVLEETPEGGCGWKGMDRRGVGEEKRREWRREGTEWVSGNCRTRRRVEGEEGEEGGGGGREVERGRRGVCA
ncbi:hypothetical protein C8J57DRAFT_116870 [Mycena rebaudengoi]|nr:hypothetical protein C8J57DRAFT_116870 [Mycena rebaudengoi]